VWLGLVDSGRGSTWAVDMSQKRLILVVHRLVMKPPARALDVTPESRCNCQCRR
jgi:hypothetical protein